MTERPHVKHRVKLVKALYCIVCDKVYAYRLDREFCEVCGGRLKVRVIKQRPELI